MKLEELQESIFGKKQKNLIDKKKEKCSNCEKIVNDVESRKHPLHHGQVPLCKECFKDLKRQSDDYIDRMP